MSSASTSRGSTSSDLPPFLIGVAFAAAFLAVTVLAFVAMLSSFFLSAVPCLNGELYARPRRPDYGHGSVLNSPRRRRRRKSTLKD